MSDPAESDRGSEFDWVAADEDERESVSDVRTTCTCDELFKERKESTEADRFRDLRIKASVLKGERGDDETTPGEVR